MYWVRISNNLIIVIILSSIIALIPVIWIVFPEHHKNERIEMLEGEICPEIAFCKLRPSQISGYCYFESDC